MAASNNGQHDVVDLLLQYGADPNRQDHVSIYNISLAWFLKLRSPLKCTYL